MSTQAKATEQQTFQVDDDAADQVGQLAEVRSFLDAYEKVSGSRPKGRCLLIGAEEGESVELPETAYRALRQVVDALEEGKAVTVAPHTKTLTTQQAADILGVSRLTVVKLIERGVLEADVPGVRRRRLMLTDVLEYRDRRREQQYQALMDTSGPYNEPAPDSDEVSRRSRKARDAVAAEHQQRG